MLVAGAGIVGIASALWLQRAGFAVTLADGNSPGSGASSGNAGTIATYGCVPINSPSILRDLPRLMTTRHGPLRLDLAHALRNLTWTTSFLRNCTPTRVRHITRALGDLLSRTYAGYTPLIDAAEAHEFISSKDFLYCWEKEVNWDAAQRSLATRRAEGVAFDELTGDEIATLEPGISLRFARGVRFTGGEHIVDPEGFARHLADYFTASGGELMRANVARTDASADHVAVQFADGTARTFRQIVITAGAHAHRIAGSGAEDLPLGTERGYHLMFADAANRVSRPVLWGERGFYATPMRNGLRIAGTVEIASLDAPPTPERLEALKDGAQRMFGDLGSPSATWLGFRPTMPDSLPVIGPSHRSPRILFAFGHQHIGLTLAGITGRIIADLAADRRPNFDISAFAPTRFSGAR